MTAAECCGQCRHIRICRERCGTVHEAGPSDMRPAPRSRDREAMLRRIDAVVALVFIGFTGGLLALVSWAAP